MPAALPAGLPVPDAGAGTTLQLTWWLLIGFFLIGYAILDGFDLGVGILQLFTRREAERRLQLAAIAPVWDGNEVWLVTAGAVLFAAFPKVYATLCSSLYLALVLLLVALISRAVAIEFRGQLPAPGWRRAWDLAFGLGSLATALLLGVAVGNVARGLPLNEARVYTGTFLGLLNPYALLTGALSVGLFALHGSLYLCTKVDGELRQRLARWTTGLWLAVVLLVLATLAASAGSARHLFAGAGAKPALGLLLLALLGGLAYLPVGVKTQRFKAAFAASATVIAALLGGLGVLLFPRTLPSTLAPAGSLTVADSSSPTTLGAMLGIAAVGVPLIVAYTAVVYRTFRGRPLPHDDGY